MKPQQLSHYNNNITHYIAARRILAAMATLSSLMDTANAPWELRQELSKLSESYQYLMQYALDGTADPHREEVYSSIVNGIVDLTARVNRFVRAQSDSTLYFNTLRYELMQTADSITSLVDTYRRQSSDAAMAAISGDDSPAARNRRLEMEVTLKRLFNRVWVTFPLTADDAAAVTSFLTDDSADPTARMLLVSALLLALLTNYDERAMRTLLTVYHDESAYPALRMRALTAALMAMSLHRKRIPGRKLRALLDSVRELPSWDDDVKMVSLQLIRTRDTEKITRKMRDEVIPGMMKLRPDIYKKINDNPDALPDMSNPEANPEWEEILEKSGMADKLRELQEMQQEGADVMMSTFAHLKTFPFFNDVASWFLPFDSLNSSVAAVSGSGFAKIIDAAPFLCDSDKYSVLLSVAQMPEQQREMVSRQFDMQNEQLREMAAAELEDPRKTREAETRNYVQSLYRFFKLFRRKGEFFDPFSTSLNLATVPLLADIFDRPDHLQVVAEFYFRHGYYDDAIELFRRLEKMGEISLQLYQKLGYSLQQNGDLAGAIDAYSQAELLAPDDVWTQRRLASAYRLQGEPAKALPYYRRIAKARPDDLNVALMTGHCLLEIGDYKEAIAQYFKVEYLDEKSLRAVRPIAWCSFLIGDYERAADYYSRIPGETLNSGDHLNMGHLAMVTGRYRDAMVQYFLALDKMGGDRAKFAKSMQTDLPHLRRAGVPDFMTGLVLDAIQRE